MKHELVRLAGSIDWQWLDSEIRRQEPSRSRCGEPAQHLHLQAEAWRVSRQKPGAFGVIKHELHRRFVIEAVIGHLKAEGHLGRRYLKRAEGDAATAMFTAVGYNQRLVLA